MDGKTGSQCLYFLFDFAKTVVYDFFGGGRKALAVIGNYLSLRG